MYKVLLVVMLMAGCSLSAARNLQGARGLDVAGNGDIIVIARSQADVIVALYEDEAGNSQRVNLGGGGLGLNHGIKLHGGYLYASSDTTVYRWPYDAGSFRQPLANQQTVITGIPGSGHNTRTLEFDLQGRLYVSVGSFENLDSNSTRSRLLRFDLASGSLPKTYGSATVFADGLRNEVGVRRDSFGRIWGVENGLDNIGVYSGIRSDFGDIHFNNPTEEVNLFLEENMNKHYGYPYCWSEGPPDSGIGVSFPQGQGVGTQWATKTTSATYTDAYCKNESNVIPPRYGLMAHSAPLDILFYSGDTFLDTQGQSMKGKVAFVSLHGSWNRPGNPSGRAVVVLSLDSNGIPVSESSLLTGPDNWGTRPVAMVVGPCKAYSQCLFFSDDQGQAVHAIAYAPQDSTVPIAPIAPPTTQPPVGLEDPQEIQLATGLTFTYSLLPNNEVFVSVTKQGIDGWLFLGFNLAGGMLDTEGVLVTGATNRNISSIYVNSYVASEILATRDTTSWAPKNATTSFASNSATLSFIRPLPGKLDIPLNGSVVYITVAWHGTADADFEQALLPKHTGAGGFEINFSNGFVYPTPVTPISPFSPSAPVPAPESNGSEPPLSPPIPSMARFHLFAALNVVSFFALLALLL